MSKHTWKISLHSPFRKKTHLREEVHVKTPSFRYKPKVWVYTHRTILGRGLVGFSPHYFFPFMFFIASWFYSSAKKGENNQSKFYFIKVFSPNPYRFKETRRSIQPSLLQYLPANTDTHTLTHSVDSQLPGPLGLFEFEDQTTYKNSVMTQNGNKDDHS